MSKKIVIKTRCFCCDHVEYPITITKPDYGVSKGFTQECLICGSFNTYRVSVKSEQIKIETTFVRASEEGIEEYEKRTGNKYPFEIKQV